MQLNRLFQMIYLLLEKESMTAAELAQRFEVSARTIYRDVDVLSAAGIPIYASKGKGGGIHLLPEFVMNKSLLTETQQNEILFALQSLQAAHADDGNEILERLRGMFRRQTVGDWIDIDFSHWGSGVQEREKFRLLKKAVLEKRVISFDYYSSYGQKSTRQAEPVKLTFKAHDWYLQAFCLEKQAMRTFKILRMDNICLTQASFTDREILPPLEPQSLSPENIVRLNLWISPQAAYRVFDSFEPQQISVNTDGSLHVEVCFPEDQWVYSFLLSFGEDLKVLSPPHIRSILLDKVSKIQKNYETVL